MRYLIRLLSGTIPAALLIIAALLALHASDSIAKDEKAEAGTNTVDHLKGNEELVFGFTTKKGKVLTIAKDKEDKYIVYRYGSPGKVEFEFPPGGKDSFKLMTYSSHSSMGSANVSSLTFVNGDFKYRVYDYSVTAEYAGEENSENVDDDGWITSIGISLTNQKTGKEFDIEGDVSTSRGGLYRLGNLKELKTGDE